MIASHPDRESLHSDPFEDDSAVDFAATQPEEFRDSESSLETLGDTSDDERPLEALPTIGYVGRYALKHLLGAGGLGTVHAALDPLLSRPIAVKTLRLDVPPAQREALESQLLAEARAAAGLNHPYIVTVFDAGVSEQGVHIAMERLAGRDLRHLLADGWRPDPRQAVRIAKRVADALAYAHSRGVIHCDIKPANIYMTSRTQPKVLDFGIARVAQQQRLPEIMIDTAAAEAAAPSDLASPYYAAPELLRGDALDARCDVYGTGVVLYELLTGQRAVAGESIDSIRHAVLHTDPPAVRTLRPEVDAALSDIVARAMARDPAQRFRSARHLARALRRWMATEIEAGLSPQPAALPRRSRSERLAARSARLVRSNRRWRVFAGLGLGAAAVFVVLSVRHASFGSAGGPPQVSSTPTGGGLGAAQPWGRSQGNAAPTVPSLAAPTIAAAAPPEAVPVTGTEAAVVTGRERRAARPAPTPAPARHATVPAAPPGGVVQFAVSPWGQIEVDGVAAGTTPPLSRLTLPAGRHRIVIRNGDFPPLSASVVVDADKPLILRHRFGT